jgi:alpha/beta superfamily hydrolase
MTNYLKAINELIEYFDNRPTFVVGHSRGGSMAMLAGTTNPHITHFISVMSRASANAVNKSISQGKSQTTYRDTPEDPHKRRSFDLPYSYFEDANHYDMIDGLSKCLKPKMFIMGTRDTVVKSEFVHEAYHAAAEPKVLEVLDSEHDYRRDPALIEEVNQLLRNFLETHDSSIYSHEPGDGT